MTKFNVGDWIVLLLAQKHLYYKGTDKLHPYRLQISKIGRSYYHYTLDNGGMARSLFHEAVSVEDASQITGKIL